MILDNVVVLARIAGIAIICTILILLKCSKKKPRNRMRGTALGSMLDFVPPVDEKFVAENVTPEQYRPFTPGKWRLTMGLRRIERKDWLLMDQNVKETLLDRKGSVETIGDKVILYQPSDRTKEALYELYDTVVDFMSTRFPKYYQIRGRNLYNTILGTSLPAKAEGSGLSERELLERLGYNFEEDLLLLEYDDSIGEYVLKAGTWVYVAGFDAAELLNFRLSDLHREVPHYDEKLKTSMNRFFLKLKVNEFVQRTNWAIQTGTTRCTPDNMGFSKRRSGDPEEGESFYDWTEKDVDNAYMRVERQTLSRLPKSRFIVFTLRTYLYAIKQIKEEGLGEEMADAIDQMDFSFAEYKGRLSWGDVLTTYLRND